MDIKEFQITYEDIVKFHDRRIKAAERDLEKLKNTRELSMYKLGRMVSIESDIKYHTMVKEACERQVPKPIEYAGRCLTCDEIWYGYDDGYCTNCGQKLEDASYRKEVKE